MQNRVILLLAVLAMCSCGSSGVGKIDLNQVIQLGDTGSQSEQVRTTDEIEPIYESSELLRLFAINGSGFLTDPQNPTLQIREVSATTERIEWEVVDISGVPRPVYFRLNFSDSAWQPDELYRGDWAGSAKALFVPVFTHEGDLEVGISVLRGENLQPEYCKDKVVARLVWVPKGSKAPRSLPPEEESGSGDHSSIPSLNKGEHNWFPFVLPTDTSEEFDDEVFFPLWEGYDNRIEAYTLDDNPMSLDYREVQDAAIERNKISAILDQIDQSVSGISLSPHVVFNDDTNDEVTFNFAYQLHGDYDLNGQVNIADITPVAVHWDLTTSWDAQGAADDTNKNPFVTSNGVVADTPESFADGSMNGEVKVGTLDIDDPNFQQLFNQLEKTPAHGQQQYENDLSPVYAHYQERIDKFLVTFEPDSGPTIKETIDYDFNSSPLGRRKFSVTKSYHEQYETYSRDFHSATWDIRVRCVLFDEGKQTEDSNTETFIEDAFTVPSGHELLETDVFDPYFPSNPGGVISVDAYAPTYRSARVTWEAASDDHSGIAEYIIYAKLYGEESSLTVADVLSRPDAVRDEISHTKTAEIVWLDNVITTRENWAPGAKIAVVVVAKDAAGNKTTSGLNLEDGYVSYDYSAPFFVGDVDLSEGESTEEVLRDDTKDVIRYSWGVHPNGTKGFSVYWGYAKDNQTGISDYRIFWDDAEFDEESEVDALQSTQSFAASEFDTEEVVEAYQLYNRFFFVEAATPTTDTWVLVKAYNGEGDRSQNLDVKNLAFDEDDLDDMDADLFQRITLSDDLNVDFDTGEMATEAWHHSGSSQNTAQGLFVVFANNDGFTPSGGFWKPPIEGFEYAPGTDPLLLDEYGVPVNWSGWDSPNVSEGLQDYTTGTQYRPDTTTDMSAHCELSAEYDIDGSTIRIAVPSIGTAYDKDGIGGNDSRHAYISRIDWNGTSSTATAPYFYNQEMFGTVDSTYWSLPTDLSASALGFSFPWSSHYPGGETAHAPTFTRNDFTGNRFMEHPLYVVGGELKSGELDPHVDDQAILESVTWDGNYWTSSGDALTIWGIEDFATSDDGEISLYCYWHQFSDLKSGSTYDNQIRPTEVGPFSFELNPSQGPVVTQVEDGDNEVGLPATISLLGDTGYILYNTASSYGGTGLGLARTTTTAGNLEYNTDLSSFPRLVWTTDETEENDIRLLRDSLDALFIDTVLNRRGGTLVSFDHTVGSDSSWTGLEQPEHDETTVPAPGWISTEFVMAISFIQSRASGFGSGLPGREVYYGEVFNLEGTGGSGAPDSSLLFLTLVDSIELTESDARAAAAQSVSPPDKFEPIWLTLGATYGVDENPYQVPVIAYGVDLGDNSGDANYGDGEAKIASIPSLMIKTGIFWNDIGNIWVYGTDPEEGIDYDPGMGQTFGVDVNGSTVSTGVLPQAVN